MPKGVYPRPGSGFCGVCKIRPAASNTSYCKQCRAKKQRDKRADGQSPEQREKNYAHFVAGRLRRSGHYDVSACAACGTSENIQLHHPDYSMPFVVIAVCRRCHFDIHFGSLGQSGLRVQIHDPAEFSGQCANRCGRMERVTDTGTKRSYCLECLAGRSREWRKTHPVDRSVTIRKQCREVLRYHQKKGRYPLSSCEICGSTDGIAAYHQDFCRPFDFNSLCAFHWKAVKCGECILAPLPPSIDTSDLSALERVIVGCQEGIAT